MTDHASRTADGARDTIALLEALVSNDIPGAEAIINHCDPQPTMFCLASAWISLAEYAGLDIRDSLAQMRAVTE